MARHTQQGRDYFHLSSPMSGCFLPDEVQHFFFSVCAPISGRFKQTLELLTVPAVSGATRTVIELIALIDPVEPCASQAAVGVGKSMTTKLEQRAAEDAARKTLSASEEQEGAALRSAIQAMEAARDGPKRAVEAHHAESRAVWEKENTFPADGLPYNREVFDTLQQIHHNLRDTIASLGGREIPREWAGDLVQYSLDINLLRDNPTKSVLREAVDVLLRAARVSEREEEPLNELLPRAARALALYEQQRLTPGVQEELTTGQLLHEVPTEEPAPPKEKEKGGARPTSSAGKAAKTAGGKVPPTTPAVAPVLGSLRHQRKEQVFAQLSAEERRLLEDESDLLLARWETSMEATREEQTADYLRHFRHVLAAVQLPLLEVMTHYRREDLKDIQTFADIKVNPATETVTSPPTRSSSKKR
ncbi:hypothetical protein AGDE_08263 [Angomonas deanei]|nr:hypothetical protein AGDE_08263 [Angomonas deanei]|eukprot:EPY33479.1 hypothetical protein AGDE_08263 [Angomonas deanei]